MGDEIHIGISLGKQRSFQDGLGEFSRQLCSRLAARAPQLKSERGWHLHFYLPEALHGVFGPQVHYLAARPLHEFWHRQPQRFAVWHTLNQIIRLAPPQGTVHRVLTVHDLNFFYFKKAYSRWRDVRRVRKLLQRSDQVVTISRYVARDIRERLGESRDIEVIYNGARNLSAAPQAAVVGLRSGEFLFHLSRMTASKNVQALLDMAAQWPEMPLVLAGPQGPHLRAVQSRCEAEGLRQVTVLPDISDEQKAWLYAHCRGFAFPSLTEGFGLPVIEAMHFGRPVFISDRTSLPEVGADVAFYWRNFDPHGMRSVVEAGLQTAQAPGWADRVRAHAAQFDWDRCAEQHIQLYARLLSPEADGVRTAP